MACDRFVYWKGEYGPRPSRDTLGHIIEDYLGGAAKEIKWDKDRFFVTLQGQTSSPFRRSQRLPLLIDSLCRVTHHDRWIEVWPDGKCCDIITRQADEYTSAVADGLQALLLRFYEASEEKPKK